MSLFTAIKIIEILLTFFKILAFALFSLKGFAILPVYSVGIFLFLLFKIAVFPRVFLFLSAKVIIQAIGHINQVFLNIREFLYGHRVLYLYTQALIKLGHFSAIGICHSRRILNEFNQVLRDRNRLYQL